MKNGVQTFRKKFQGRGSCVHEKNHICDFSRGNRLLEGIHYIPFSYLFQLLYHLSRPLGHPKAVHNTKRLQIYVSLQMAIHAQIKYKCHENNVLPQCVQWLYELHLKACNGKWNGSLISRSDNSGILIQRKQWPSANGIAFWFVSVQYGKQGGILQSPLASFPFGQSNQHHG